MLNNCLLILAILGSLGFSIGILLKDARSSSHLPLDIGTAGGTAFSIFAILWFAMTICVIQSRISAETFVRAIPRELPKLIRYTITLLAGIAVLVLSFLIAKEILIKNDVDNLCNGLKHRFTYNSGSEIYKDGTRLGILNVTVPSKAVFYFIADSKTTEFNLKTMNITMDEKGDGSIEGSYLNNKAALSGSTSGAPDFLSLSGSIKSGISTDFYVWPKERWRYLNPLEIRRNDDQVIARICAFCARDNICANDLEFAVFSSIVIILSN
jgi:hypothetical protein